MTIQVRGLTEANAALAQLSRDLPRAAVKATDRLVFKVWEAEKAQMVADLDRPRPFALGAIRYKRPKLTDPVGEVYVVNQFGQGVAREDRNYIGMQIGGGRRTFPKRSERALQSMGIMPRGTVWVPSSFARLDASGNIGGTTIKRLVTEFRAHGRRRHDDRRFYVRGGVRAAAQGIWQKIGRRWLPLVYFVPTKTYRRRFKFYERGNSEVAYHFRSIYGREIDRERERLGLL
jgi:hypothetical protein